MVTSSPSARKVRRLPSGSVSGSRPPQLSSSSDPYSSGAGPTDRPAGEEVAGSRRRPVGRQVGELLGGGPVGGPERRAGDHVPVEPDLEGEVQGGVPGVDEVGQQRDVARGRGDARVLERRPRHHPRRDRRRERLAEERAQRHVLPGLHVAGGPVVHQHHAEEVVGGLADRDRLPERAVPADHEADLGLDVEALGGPERRRPVVGPALPVRPAHGRARDDDRPGPPVVGDGQVLPVRRQGRRPGAQDAPDVRGVVLARVEVDVVADGEGQVHRHRVAPVVQRVAASGRSASRESPASR